MKSLEKTTKLFDYMQEQANNLFDYCEKNGIDLENPGFFIDPTTGYAHISASTKKEGRNVILTRDKHHNEHGGKWDEGVELHVCKKEKCDE